MVLQRDERGQIVGNCIICRTLEIFEDAGVREAYSA